MSTYQIAIGHNNAAGLADIDPQPRTPRLIPGRVVYAVSGLVYEDGGYRTQFIYDALGWDDYTALLTAFGLSSAKSALVTVRLRKDTDNSFANYNAIIERPTFDETAEARLSRLVNITFNVHRIVAI